MQSLSSVERLRNSKGLSMYGILAEGPDAMAAAADDEVK
jgi:hypothetical protein